VAEGDSATAGYTLVNLSLVRHFNLGRADAMAFAKLGNAADKLAYNASTIQTIRGLSPVAGRALQFGMRVAFWCRFATFRAQVRRLHPKVR